MTKYALIILAATLTVAAQQPRLSIDLHGLDRQARENTQIALDGPMLRAAASNADGDAEAQQALKNLKGVYIHHLEFASPVTYPPGLLKGIASQLGAPAWHMIVQTRDGHEQTWIAVQRDREVVTALALVNAQPNELTIINIIGPLPHGLASLSALGALGGSIGKLGKLGNLGKVDGSAKAASARPELHSRTLPSVPASPGSR